MFGLSKAAKELDNLKPKENKTRHKDTVLLLNSCIYNKFVEFIPSDFTEEDVRQLFIRSSAMSLPRKTRVDLFLYPNDTENTLKVIVVVDKYYKNGAVVINKKMFKPFWITGFNQVILNIETDKPSETNYRVSNNPYFAFTESENITRRKISSRIFSPEATWYKVEKDFKRARETKNKYIRNYIERLSKIPNSQWECVPNVKINWRKKEARIVLYIKKSIIKNSSTVVSLQVIDRFNVIMGDLLDTKKKNKPFDVNTMCYLVALNAIYKDVKVFSYSTLYEVYKLLSMKLLDRGYLLEDIKVDNLSNLKLIDLSSHYVCHKKMFNDRLLHIMNIMSANEEYYRMKFIYTAQKNPSILYSEHIVKHFKTIKKNDMGLILKNSEERHWRSLVDKLDQVNLDTLKTDKDFYINNYNVFDISNRRSHDVESFLMDHIKTEKDDITRLSKLGEEVLKVSIEESKKRKSKKKQKYTKKELEEIKKFEDLALLSNAVTTKQINAAKNSEAKSKKSKKEAKPKKIKQKKEDKKQKNKPEVTQEDTTK